MNLLDIILGIILAIGVVAGIKDGLIRQVAGLLGLVAGIFLGKMWYLRVAEKLDPLLGTSEKTTQIIAFILILILVPAILSFLAWLVSKWLSSVGLGGFNRFLGAIFGALKYALFAGILITAVESFDTEGHLVTMKNRQESVLYGPIHSISDVVLKEVKQQIKEWKEEHPDSEPAGNDNADKSDEKGFPSGNSAADSVEVISEFFENK
ncbi:MAG: CvpA family protein [Bacteroidaceae bacterium]|nr:CvpA family protein [Bacteroidaceae bacterium]